MHIQYKYNKYALWDQELLKTLGKHSLTNVTILIIIS